MSKNLSLIKESLNRMVVELTTENGSHGISKISIVHCHGLLLSLTCHLIDTVGNVLEVEKWMKSVEKRISALEIAVGKAPVLGGPMVG